MRLGLTDLILDVLATQRLTRLVTEDQITEPVRELVWKRFDPEETKIGYFVTCPHCVSVWAGGLIALLTAGGGPPSRGVFGGTVAVFRYTLALSGATSLVREVLDR